MTKKLILHGAAFFGAIMAFGVIFDAWWHIAFGRDSFFILPHLFVYSGVTGILALSAVGWKRFDERAWRRVFWIFLIIPFSLPFDQFWHWYRGLEQVNSVLIVWSPPHILLFASAITGLFFILSILLKEKEKGAVQEFYGVVLLASLLTLLFIMSGPFFPFSPFALLGYTGAIIASFLMVSILLLARRLFTGIFPALLVSIFAVSFQFVLSDASITYGTRAIGSFPNIPNWVLLLSFVSVGIIIDLPIHLPKLLRGLLAGLVSSAILYGLAYGKIDPKFGLDAANVLIAILSGTMGGILAAGGMRKNRQKLKK